MAKIATESTRKRGRSQAASEEPTVAVNGTAKKAKLVRTNGKATKPYSRDGPGRPARTSSSVTSSTSRTVVNEIPTLPTQRLNVYVFGSGSLCELGLGPNVTEVKRPRLNPLLPIDEIGIVSLAVGGAHVIAIDYAGKLWTWGQNDSGVLGRYTKEDYESGDVDLDNDINALESTPSRVTGIPDHLKFVAVAASDNLSAAITDEGHLWAWGTFIDDGDKAFKSGIEIQTTPVYISQIRGAVGIAGGKDHLLIVDKYGQVYAWGTGQNYQLGVQVNARLRTKTFGPIKIKGLKNIKSVAAGEYHSFAIDIDNKLWAWGLNNFGQCATWGSGDDNEAGSGVSVTKPTLAKFFEDKEVAQVDGGNHHSLILTTNGEVYAVGEMNFNQLGIPTNALPESTVREKNGSPSYVPIPTKLTTGMSEEQSLQLPKFKYIATGTDHSLAVSAEDGSIWTWGFGEVYQLGHGKPAGEDSPEDEEVPTRIKNTATTGVNMVFVGAGGQFSVSAGLPREE
ncbi:Srm1p [Sugiyamaella lignohabitans]|uniref:Srm1p n=1 Tax=Sugiyamaella lignohabitans TaxID=796027 RepID=A0A167DIR6_9ASCO|nr:Srm1p [Sugiyamaella lignohabitans]ANB12961.1 Srm1p [Sugiyamaella lignohabitans]